MKLAPVTLRGRGVALEPMTEAHADELYALTVDASVWTYHPIDAGPSDRWLHGLVRLCLDGPRDAEVPFVVRRLDSGAVVGSTSYLAYAEAHRRIEIGRTFYVEEARGTFVNPACKLLLMTHAFETMGLQRLELKCDLRNERSRRAILGLGAKEEGILRKHTVYESGYARDTNYFSVLEGEWPDVKARLEARLGG